MLILSIGMNFRNIDANNCLPNEINENIQFTMDAIDTNYHFRHYYHKKGNQHRHRYFQ